jgi:sugar lactone lactonase YvrE
MPWLPALFSPRVVSECTFATPIHARRRRSVRLAAMLAAVAALCLGSAAAQVTQLPTWTELNPATSPTPSLYSAAAYDSASGQLVLFGGYTTGYSNETWTWTGSTWTQQSPATSPPGRYLAAMAFDAASGQIVLFGGDGSSGVLGDTWTWNGSTWTQQSPASNPPARSDAMMAYDAASGQVVLFGGEGNSGDLGDTWTWNGSNWTQQSPASSPPARSDAAMTYDAASSQVVLFSGFDGAYLTDTWTWNGSNWTEQSPATSPSARELASVAFDASIGDAVLFGGWHGNYLSDTWMWNGSTWTELSPSSGPSGRYGAPAAYDAASGQIVLFGGVYGDDLDDTWAFESGSLTLGTANVCPSGASTPSPCSQSATLSFNVAADTTIGSIKILTQGATGLDFQATPDDSSSTLCAAQTYSSQTTCTVDVTFAPLYAGQRLGAVVLDDGSGNSLASVYVYGTGTGPQVAFNAGTISTLGGGFDAPAGVAVDASGNVYVADFQGKAVDEMSAGCASSTCVTTLGGGFGQVNGVAVDGSGNIYVADWSDGAVQEMPAGCASPGCVTRLGGVFGNPRGVAVDGIGNIYIADESDSALYEMPPGCASSSCVTTLGGGFGNLEGVAVDANGNIYVADGGNRAVEEVPSGCTAAVYTAGNCTITTLGGGFVFPASVALDPSGNVYVADVTDDSAVKEIPSGCVSSNCVITLGGAFEYPTGIALDGSGNIYVASGNDAEVNEIARTTPPSLSFANTVANSGNSSDSPQTVTLQNIGNATLTFPVPTSSGNYNPSITSNFAYDSSSTCTQTAFGESAYMLAAGASCTLAVDFAPTSVGSISGSLVLTDNSLNAASPSFAMQTINLSGTGEPLESQTIDFPAITGSYDALGSVTLSATASSGLPVSFTSTTPAVCTVSGNTASLEEYGDCTIQASQAGNADYAAAPTVTQTFLVHHATQSISFAAIPTEAVNSTVALSATATSGLPVSFASITTSVCTVSGDTASLIGGGTCKITASQAGNSVYLAAPSVGHEFSVTFETQTITFPAISSGQVAATSIALTATASSGLPVTFTSTTPAVCTVSGSTASLLEYGDCTIEASQAGNADYAAAPTVTQTFLVHHATQSISFAAIPTQAVNSTVTLSATATSGLPVSFASITTSVCTVSGDTASLIATGKCEITASQAGNNVYLAAPSVGHEFSVTLETQTITFPAISSGQVAGTSIAMTATASSGLPVTFSSTTPAVCTLSGNTASLEEYGDCTIEASQAGNADYAAAPTVTQTFLVHHATQTISFAAIPTQAVNSTVTLSATATSGLPVSFASITNSVCTVSGDTASLIATGRCEITASQAGNNVYLAAPTVGHAFSVTQ